MTDKEIFEILKDKFGETIMEFVEAETGENYIKVSALEIDKVCAFLFLESKLQFDSLVNLSGVDDANGEKKTEEDGSFEYIGGTLSVFYHLESTEKRHKVTLSTSVEKDKPDVVSVTEVWAHANWHEREAFDLLGINFLNHPDLRRILMPYDWEAGYPLRKDYKDPDYYQGMKVPY